jgi:hypothetical protein
LRREGHEDGRGEDDRGLNERACLCPGAHDASAAQCPLSASGAAPGVMT